MAPSPSRPATPKRALCAVLAAALIATLLFFAAPSAQAQNLAPIAAAGPDQTLPIGPTQRTLHGARSFDVDGNVTDLTFQWMVVTPTYNWLHITHTGSPHGSEATFIAPSQSEVNRYGNTITFRLTVTDPQGASATDTVTYRFEGPPSAAIALTAFRPAAGIDDLDQDDCEDEHEDFSVNAVTILPNQSGNDDNEWHIKEGSCLTLRGIGTLPAGSTGRVQYFWQKISAVPNRSAYNVPVNRRTRDSFSLLLPNDFQQGQSAILHYTLTVTSPTGLQVAATVRINVVDVPGVPTVELDLLDARQPVQDANALDPNAPVQRYVVQPGATVQLIAIASDEDTRQERSLEHEWSGPGVEESANNRAGTTSRAIFTVPSNAVVGQSFTAEVAVTDATGFIGRDQATFTVAINVPPEATAPRDFPTEDGPLGGTNRRGTVFITGTGSDRDGDVLAYRWVQVDSSNVPLRKPTVELMNANTDTVSFASPQVPVNGEREIHLAFTVADKWGVGDTDYVTVTVLGRNERPIADAGPDQIVEPGSFVRLDGTASVDPDPGTQLLWSWAYTGFATTPPQIQRPLTSYERNVVLRAFLPDGTDYSGLDPLLSKFSARPSFIAPELGGLDSVQLTFTLTLSDRAGGVDRDTVTITVTSQFFSGIVDGPDFCTNHSLGGPRTYAFDSDNDGVADICSLPYTRREAVARQNALVTLASLNEGRYRTEALSACEELTEDYGDSPESLDNDACETRAVAGPPPPVDPILAQQFFSGVISGPDFCTNLSLGGPRTYAFDSDNDGVADICSLPYTRREAIARQNALEIFTTPEAVFDNAVALACRELGSTTFEGDSAGDMARDACA
ncbi:hypothetical protein [Candidatus Poriferisocius sp.]|uniref:hypothetical protein n=1 Tax=Candidatus Poriferisocius sp. TaxID=3101276 RepID=UPI003B5A3D67